MSTVSVIGSTYQIGNPVEVSALRQIRERRGWTQKDLAKRLNTTDVSVSRYEKEDNRLTLPLLKQMSKALGCSIAEIVGEADLQANPPPAVIDGAVELMGEVYAAIPVFAGKVAAGDGAIIDVAEPVHHHLFRRDWLRQVTSSAPPRLAVVKVDGDSMWDTLHHGDQVLMDTGVTRIARDSIYVLSWAGEEDLIVKRCQRDPRSRLITVKSDNAAYETWRDVRDDAIRVHGQVIWLGRNIGG